MKKIYGKVKIRRITYKPLFLEKDYFFNFIKKTKINFYYKPTTLLKNLIFLNNKNIGILNINFLVLTLKKMFNQIMQIAFFRGVFVIGGINSEYINIGRKLFYTFDKWHPGFITNFFRLIKNAKIKQFFNSLNIILPKRITKLRRFPQLPSYSISLIYQHYQINEAAKIKIPQISVINNYQNINKNFTNILTINEQNITKVLLIYFIKECILERKRKIIKNIVRQAKKNKILQFFELKKLYKALKIQLPQSNKPKNKAFFNKFKNGPRFNKKTYFHKFKNAYFDKKNYFNRNGYFNKKAYFNKKGYFYKKDNFNKKGFFDKITTLINNLDKKGFFDKKKNFDKKGFFDKITILKNNLDKKGFFDKKNNLDKKGFFDKKDNFNKKGFFYQKKKTTLINNFDKKDNFDKKGYFNKFKNN